MKIKTNELEGIALDWAVATCEGLDYFHPDTGPAEPAYSTNWSLAGPIIERQDITVLLTSVNSKPVGWAAEHGFGDSYIQLDGPTPLIAAMRCFVASRLGDEVEIPDALVR